MRHRLLPLAGLLLGLSSFAADARAEDLSSVVAKAHDLIDNGNYPDALKVLQSLKGKTLPPTLAIEAGLLEANASLVTSGTDAGIAACGKAIVAANYDPEVARDQSPKIREACRTSAKKIRSERLKQENISLGDFAAPEPDVAYQPIRVSATATHATPWLKVVARITSSELAGSFDLRLIPNEEGKFVGTLDPSWIRPNAKLTMTLVAGDSFGDLGGAAATLEIAVPKAEAMIQLDSVPDGATVTLDGTALVPDKEGRMPTTEGKHEVSLTVPTGAVASSNVEVKRGNVTRISLAPQQPNPSRALPWIATGTAFALAVAGGILLITAETQRSQLLDAAAAREPGTDLPANDYSTLKNIDDRRRTFNTVGTGLLIGAGGTAILATILWAIPTRKSTKSSAASLMPVVSPGFTGLTGTF